MAENRPSRGRRERADKPKEQSDLVEKVVFINRCAKVVKGGRRFSFSALIVTGDKAGRVGSAKKAMVKVALSANTIPHEAYGEFGGGKVLLKPASAGTGVIAGGGVRAVIEAAGIRDVLAKSMGSSNHANVVKATLSALEQLRSREDRLRDRGFQIKPKAVAAAV